MKALNIIGGLVTVFITLPIWYYLMYHLMDKVGASELAWFLYYVYLPVHLFAAIVNRIAQSEK